MMDVTAITSLILQINKVIDSGNHNDITIDEVHKAIEDNRLLRFLKDRVGKGIDLSVLLNPDAYGGFEEYYEEKMNSIYNAYAGDERKKWGVQNLGLCLVLAWTNEIVQMGEDLEWSD